MHFNTVEIAALIIIWAVPYRLLTGWLEGRFNQKEKLAAKLEYEDSTTSDERKVGLLSCYADAIITPPSEKFMLAASEQIKRERKKERPFLIIRGSFSVVAAAVACLLGLFLYHLLK